MSKFGDQLRAMKIFNTHGLLSQWGRRGSDIAVSYNPGGSRYCMCAGTSVWSPSHKTDPQAHWQYYGAKRFAGIRAKTLPMAKAWAAKKYGVTEWATCPTDRGTLVPKYVIDAAKVAVAK